MINKHVFFFGPSPFKNYFASSCASQTKYNFIDSAPEVADILFILGPVTQKQLLVLNQVYESLSDPVIVVKINARIPDEFKSNVCEAVLPFKIDHEFFDDVAFDELIDTILARSKK